jgi:hypothetical protein
MYSETSTHKKHAATERKTVGDQIQRRAQEGENEKLRTVCDARALVHFAEGKGLD